MNNIAKKMLMPMIAVLLLLGILVSPANANPLQCQPPSDLYQVTVFPYSTEMLPGTTVEWQVSVDEGQGKYKYEQGYDIDTIGEIGSITKEGAHRFKFSELTKVNVVNQGEQPLEVEVCYILVE
ncbi:MAG: hypothetical protein F6K21_31350 [Symploca sp. SIO2D2]|nr:hypothetical protein [Symploca sp. SIO2D2]